MFGKRERQTETIKEPENLKAAGNILTPEPKRPPSALEILKKRRAEKMRKIRQLDKEIEMLDHDITFVERYPQHGRVLEFIASRFQMPETVPWDVDGDRT